MYGKSVIFYLFYTKNETLTIYPSSRKTNCKTIKTALRKDRKFSYICCE